jgi:hypothetical protein
MKIVNCIFFVLVAKFQVNAQIKHSVYIAPGINLYQFKASNLVQYPRFISSYQGSLGYRIQYQLNRISFNSNAELKCSNIKFNSNNLQNKYSGYLSNSEFGIGSSYRFYKGFSTGLDLKLIHNLSQSGLFFDRLYQLDKDYFAFSILLQYLFNQRFEIGIHVSAPFGI